MVLFEIYGNGKVVQIDALLGANYERKGLGSIIAFIKIDKLGRKSFV